jgi:RimJ/RimL family protein N-acetyltransferase
MDNIFETGRLVIRPIQSDDAESVFSYRSDSIVNQYQGWIPETIADVYDFISIKISSVINQPNTWFQFVIIKKSDNRLIGDIGVHFIDTTGFQIELGCTLDKNYQGQGYATEALSTIIGFMFHGLNKRRIIASVDPRNLLSLRLIERLGFRKEAHFKQSILINNEWVDDLVYAILKDEWIEKDHRHKGIKA